MSGKVYRIPGDRDEYIEEPPKREWKMPTWKLPWWGSRVLTATAMLMLGTLLIGHLCGHVLIAFEGVAACVLIIGCIVSLISLDFVKDKS